MTKPDSVLPAGPRHEAGVAMTSGPPHRNATGFVEAGEGAALVGAELAGAVLAGEAEVEATVGEIRCGSTLLGGAPAQATASHVARAIAAMDPVRLGHRPLARPRICRSLHMP